MLYILFPSFGRLISDKLRKVLLKIVGVETILTMLV